jgi:hypothetical protein
MTSQALTILREADADLQAHGFEMYNYGDLFSPSGYSENVGERLFETEPFRRMGGKWLADPGGGDDPIEVRVGRWAVMKLFDGTPPETIITDIERLISTDRADFADVWICSGFTVEGRVDLCSEAYLQDLAQLPGYNTNSSPPTAHCGLVLPYSVSPILVDAPPPSTPRLVASPLVNLVRRALVLSSSSPILLSEGPRQVSFTAGLPRRYQRPLGDALFPPMRVMPGPDLDMTAALIPALKKFAGVRSIEIAVDRINRARTSTDPVDAALDYGVAMEVALMHGDETAKSEISNKLGMRAGWLLGKNPTSRRAVKLRAGLLYSGRSDAAHKGYFSQTTEKKYDPDDADKLVTDIVRSIVEKGAFPNWTDLVFGG